jgi:multidrug efflux pump subunit AcrA (membrane-fusion protein)
MRLHLLAVMTLGGLMAGCSHSKPETAGAREEKKESGLVHIGAEAQKYFGLQVGPAEIRDLNEYLVVPGTVQPIDSHVNTVRPLARGRLHEVLVRVGDRVKRGKRWLLTTTSKPAKFPRNSTAPGRT